MRSGGRYPSVKRGLLAGVGLLVLAATGAAWPAAAAKPPAPAPAVKADGLQAGELYLEADLVIRDDRQKITTARGNVEARYQDRTIRAQELIYDEGRGVITARGKVSILSANGDVEYAEELVLDDKAQAGATRGFAARLQPNIKIAAASAVRRNADVNELNRVIYTPCDICAQDGSPKVPTWSIKADKVVQDHANQLVYYRNATVRIFGAPVIFLPLFWHPDPSAERKSGFLPPNFGLSNRRGVSYDQPYVQVLSPSADLTLIPQFNSKVNPVLQGKYRQRVYSGAVEARFGYTYDQDFDGKGNGFGDKTSRSYVLASGAFALDEAWRWGFTAERSSDKLLFDKYDVGDVFVARGPYVADDRRLISQVYATRQTQSSWFSVAALSVEGLRPGDNDRTFPVVAPLVEARWQPSTDILNGRLRLLGSAVALTRDQSPTNQALNLPGVDSRRVTGQADWRRSFTSAQGLRISPYVQIRADAYSLGDVSGGASATVGRVLGVAGADASWPFARKFNTFTTIVEPLIQIAVSPRARQIRVGSGVAGAPVYLNEDSLSFELDETNLFRPDKFPGYDLYDDGARINVAGRASVLWDDGRRANLLIGRSFRDETRTVFAASSGLSRKGSDWVVAADAQPRPGLSLFTRARLDAEDLTVQRAEAGVNVSMRRGVGYLRYLRDRVSSNGLAVENVDLGGEIYLSKHWGLTAYGNRDLEQQAWVIRDLGVVYRDECTRIDVIYRREDVVVGRLGNTESVTVRLTLATLGGPMYGR